MIHALLHHKLDDRTTNAHRREDTLTATIFGTLVWMEAWDTLAKWLDVPVPSHGSVTGCWFWPRLAGSVEPDVILRIGSSLVVVEAKLRSNRHDKSLAIGVEAVADETDDPVDQLVRQFIGITTPAQVRQRYSDDLEKAILDCDLIQLYVVDSMRLHRAEKEVEQSLKLMPQGHRLRSPITWQSLSTLLAARPAPGRRWERDLLEYMRMIGLDTFHGVSGRGLTGSSALLAGWRVPRRRERSFSEFAARVSASPNIKRLQHWRRQEQAS